MLEIRYKTTVIIILIVLKLFYTSIALSKTYLNNDGSTILESDLYVVDDNVNATRIYIDESSDPSNSSTPYEVYVPIKECLDNSCTAPNVGDQENYSFFGQSKNGTLLAVSLNDDGFNFNAYMTMNLYHDTTGSSLYFCAAYLDTSGNYNNMQIKNNSNNYYLGTVDSSVSTEVQINFSQICSSGTNCYSSIQSVSSVGTNLSYNQTIFLYTSASQCSSGTITPGDDGMYLNINFSSQYSTSALTSFSFLQGDEQIKSIYDGSSLSLNGTGVYLAFGYNCSGTNLSTCTDGVFVPTDYTGLTASLSGEYLVEKDGNGNSLINETTYKISMGFINKYYFSNELTAGQNITPLDIETFLEKNACFFVSAGFKRNHYILSYFKQIRDNILLKNSIGKKIVNFYYDFARQNAIYVYNNKILSTMVVVASHIVYLLLKNLAIILILVILLIIIKYKFQNLKNNLS